MRYIAHKSEDGREQTVLEHLEETAKQAADFAVPDFQPIAECLGRYHDIGKYSAEFQKRISGGGNKVEHSLAGAYELEKLVKQKGKGVFPECLLEYCIAGHHSGLPDGGTKTDRADEPTLQGRLNRTPCNFEAYKEEMSVELPDMSAVSEQLNACRDRNERIELFAFFTRYAFSCLTDADFINTEGFFNTQAERGISGDFEKALDLLNKKLAGFPKDTKVRKARSQLLEQAVKNGVDTENISVLDMPTGSGKTLCSMKLALEKAVKHHKKRIIYVIPYTSIIEQTAEIFTDLFGDSLYPLQHHSNFDYETKAQDDSGSDLTAEKLKRTCENWDAPLVITTSVQFFQSLYHYKGSRLRKLHNLADSVLIFDEIHLIPTENIQPCLRGIGYITKYLNSEAILLSATMPDYSKQIEKYIPDIRVTEIIGDRTCFKDFENCTYEDLGGQSFESIVQMTEEFSSSLIVVNTRKSARSVYKMLNGKKFHLSTYMTPEHRSRTIAEIKNCLKKRERITVVSTSLIEAGVDLDFQAVFRELAGLDSILQSGGRCNREGYEACGRVFVFETDGKPSREISLRGNIAKGALAEYDDIRSPQCIESYYNSLFNFSEDMIKRNSIARFEGKGGVNYKSVSFRKYAEQFKMIDEDTVPIVIDNSEAVHSLVQKLDFGEMSVKRRLQKYSVSVSRYEFEDILKTGILKQTQSGVYVLTNASYYSEETGLDWQDSHDEDYMS